MDLDPELAYSIAATLVEHAVAADTFVRIDMEGSDYTQATIDMVCKLHALNANRGRVGVVIQAYLYRSKADIDRLLAEGIAYACARAPTRNPPAWLSPRRPTWIKNFVRLDADAVTQRNLPRHRHPR